MKKIIIVVLCISSLHLHAQNTFPSTGNVGIGTISPVVPLEVNGELKWHGHNAGNPRSLQIGYSGGNYGGIGYNIGYTTYTGIFNRPLIDKSSYLEFWHGGFRFYGTSNGSAASDVSLNGGGSNLNLFATIADDGSFGLGTASPQYKLDVHGDARFTQFLHLTSDNQEIQFYRGGSLYGYLWSSARGLHWGKGSESTSINVNNDGNIGIGILETQGYKLAVAGSIIAESVKVKLRRAWPDYVFEKGYHVQSIKEVEEFIKRNGHLPEIPPRAEIEAEGLELGEINSRLLKKIEELTLYIIDIEKRLKRIENNKK